jgi:non-canonical purine NTP pyrophosphatase (RdgB/HAM1 family)
MKEIVFVTSNENKARYVKLWLDWPITHRSLDIPEIQSLDLHEVVTAKTIEAYQNLRQPVLVEDVALTFNGLGKLPGTFVKWFLQEIGTDGLCELLKDKDDRTATAEILYGLHDGSRIHYFSGLVTGTIAPKPQGSHGFGWNSVFVPLGQTKTYAEMGDEELKPYSHRAIALQKIKVFLNQ